jgi:hypothetical protein
VIIELDFQNFIWDRSNILKSIDENWMNNLIPQSNKFKQTIAF